VSGTQAHARLPARRQPGRSAPLRARAHGQHRHHRIGRQRVAVCDRRACVQHRL